MLCGKSHQEQQREKEKEIKIIWRRALIQRWYFRIAKHMEICMPFDAIFVSRCVCVYLIWMPAVVTLSAAHHIKTSIWKESFHTNAYNKFVRILLKLFPFPATAANGMKSICLMLWWEKKQHKNSLCVKPHTALRFVLSLIDHSLSHLSRHHNRVFIHIPYGYHKHTHTVRKPKSKTKRKILIDACPVHPLFFPISFIF